ncbi:MAG TPA: DUF4340 domain-containing protein [Candidatus Binatia bacterium]|nr:DUF4340 domain-containing protein [Candidatus Binatia bacterium]
MRTRGTVLLLLLVVAGGAWLWFEGPSPDAHQQDPLLGGESNREPTQPTAPLLEFAPDDVTQITLTRDKVQRVARKLGGKWPDTIPPGALADFLHNLTGLAELMRLELGPSEMEPYGLDPPQAEIELTRNSGPPLLLLIGNHNPSATGAYVRIGRTGPVILAGALVVWEFDKAFRALDQLSSSKS